MEIAIQNKQKDLKVAKAKVKAAVKEFLLLEGIVCDEVAIHFVTTPKICALHDEFFQDPTPTDCISFPMDSDELCGPMVLGEVFVCPETAVQYANRHGGDPHEECLLYIIHGLLHLIGYDDIDPSDRKKMRLREKKHMKNLQSKGLTIK